MEAKSSMAVEKDDFSCFGQICVMNTAMPTAVGAAKIKASEVTTTVPYTAEAPPNTFFTGFHVVEIINPISPNFFKAGMDSYINVASMRIRIKGIIYALAAVR